MTTTISLAGVSRHYRGHVALDDVTLDVQGPTITGLLGRNGAGKTTLMRIIAAQQFPTAGQVLVLGASPVENDAILRRMVFVREDQVFPDIRVRDALRMASRFYPNWNAELADDLVAEFDLPSRRPVKKLSRGMRSALSIVIGLAARTEVVLFDEPYAGLDAVARQVFYDRLLLEYAEHPRTILLSTHLVDEVAGLLDQVVIINRGRLVLNAPADDLRGRYTSVSGPSAAVAELVAGRATWERRRLASQEAVVLAEPLNESDRLRAQELHLRMEPLSLQQMLVAVSGQGAEDSLERTNA